MMSRQGGMKMIRVIVQKKWGDPNKYTVYDVTGLRQEEMCQVVDPIFYQSNIERVEIQVVAAGQDEKRLYSDLVSGEYHPEETCRLVTSPTLYDGKAIRYGLLKGQYDQRADAAAQCIQLMLPDCRPVIRSSVLVVSQDINENFSSTYINPVDSEILPLGVPLTLESDQPNIEQVPLVSDISSLSTSLSKEDIALIDHYFEEQGRKPTLTEVKVLDTYWSDHCRHTTFMTELHDLLIEDSEVKEAYDEVQQLRAELGRGSYPMTLMELATIDARWCQANGMVDLDTSEEINACSIRRNVFDQKGNAHPYYIMFKNETHNHPTEIEPFGGAATCIGGAIRDPLSGRSTVYQSIRVSGAGLPSDPQISGKLSQATICEQAALGFSSYGNQIGLATGIVDEVYHSGYRAKRMEVGAVIASAPQDHVIRKRPKPGDCILLLGGKTGRDGVGGATGSSKVQEQDSVKKSAAEVQKGNAPEERKLQRLFANKAFTTKVKRCNDFGAGGVSVAVGELADSIDIQLHRVPLKYQGLTPTEIAISESQERMAVVVSPQDVEAVSQLCDNENLSATLIATVTDTGRMVMRYRDQVVVDLARSFIDINGARNRARVIVPSLQINEADIRTCPEASEPLFSKQLFHEHNASKKGLVELFDCTIGAGTVLMPFGGRYMDTPAQSAVAKIPLRDAESVTASIMAHGFHPLMGERSVFHMGMYSVLESVAKVVASGGDYRTIRLSLQEYFPKIDQDHWHLPFLALLGAGKAMRALGTCAIGGKDSMSGSYDELSVPPTLISFAVTTTCIDHIISPELKEQGHYLYLLANHYDGAMPNIAKMKNDYDILYQLIKQGDVQSASAVGYGGVASTVAKMALGNRVGIDVTVEDPWQFCYGAVIIETQRELSVEYGLTYLGRTNDGSSIQINHQKIGVVEASRTFNEQLSAYYPVHYATELNMAEEIQRWKEDYTTGSGMFVEKHPDESFENVNVFFPVFPGTNCEWDTKRIFDRYGANTLVRVFNNQSTQSIERSIQLFKEAIDCSDILVLSGGFSAGDEPDGSAKFIASVFRNAVLTAAVENLLDQRKGLILGICNGFQALIRLGLLPYGKITTTEVFDPALIENQQGRHISKIAPVRFQTVDSPWLAYQDTTHAVMTAFSHGEGRFYAPPEVCEELWRNAQVASVYEQKEFNGSSDSIEGLISADGRIFGKMGHIERVGHGLYKNIVGQTETNIIYGGLKYIAEHAKRK